MQRDTRPTKLAVKGVSTSVKAGIVYRRARTWAAATLVALGLPLALSGIGDAAAHRGTNQLIAFAGVHWTADGNPAGSQIYVVRENGTRLERLTHPAAREDTAPAWSPDTTELAFGRHEGKSWRLYVMNANGSALHAVTRPQPLAESPSWSPDGRQIVFVQLPSGLPSTGSYWQQLYVVSLASGRVRQLTHFAAFPGGASAPAWSPDGRWILFSGKKSSEERARTDIWAIDLGGAHLRRLITNGTDPAWSPNGLSIAFVRNGDVYTATATGARVRRVAHTRDDESGPSWSPDGLRMAVAGDRFTRDWKKETRRLYVMPAAGEKPQAITPADPRFWADDPSWRPGAER